MLAYVLHGLCQMYGLVARTEAGLRDLVFIVRAPKED